MRDFRWGFLYTPKQGVEPSEKPDRRTWLLCQEPDAQFQCWNLRAPRVLRTACVAPALSAASPGAGVQTGQTLQ
jgi:hypothetical protein